MYSTFTFIGGKIVEHVVARDYGAFLDQVATAVPCGADRCHRSMLARRIERSSLVSKLRLGALPM